MQLFLELRKEMRAYSTASPVFVKIIRLEQVVMPIFYTLFKTKICLLITFNNLKVFLFDYVLFSLQYLPFLEKGCSKGFWFGCWLKEGNKIAWIPESLNQLLIDLK